MTERNAKPIGRLRRLAGVLILMCLLYFSVGGIFVWLDLFALSTYLTVAGGVGALASVLGLLSLARPSIVHSDFADVDAQVLKRLGETAEEVLELEKARSQAERELNTLELQKKEMKVLVQNASLSLFLEEQRKLYEQRIAGVVRDNPELDRYLAELSGIDEKLVVLNRPIESDDPRVALLNEVVVAVRGQKPELPQDRFSVIGDAIGEAVGGLLRFYGGLFIR